MGRVQSYVLITIVVAALATVPASAKTSQPPDAWLTTKAKIAVLGKVGTKVHDGVARLDGTVPSENERLAAVATVKKVDGVRRVQDDLKVQKD
jgi:osmotically-inducible protein OsmY